MRLSIRPKSPKVVKCIVAWEEAQGNVFEFAGDPYLKPMSSQEEAYIEVRGKLRNARKR